MYSIIKVKWQLHGNFDSSLWPLSATRAWSVDRLRARILECQQDMHALGWAGGGPGGCRTSAQNAAAPRNLPKTRGVPPSLTEVAQREIVFKYLRSTWGSHG